MGCAYPKSTYRDYWGKIYLLNRRTEIAIDSTNLCLPDQSMAVEPPEKVSHEVFLFSGKHAPT